MINVSCGSCGKNYKFDPKIIKAENAKFTCKQCGYVNPIDSYISKTDTDSLKLNSSTHQSIEDVSHIDQSSSKPQTQQTYSPPSDSKQQTGQYQINRDSLQVSWKNRLQIKVNAVLIPLIVAIMTIFTIISYITEKQQMENELQNLSKVAAKRLSVYLVEAFWSLDDEILEEALKSEMLDTNIYSINLIDRSGKVIYLGYKRDENWNLITNNIPVDGEYVKAEEAIIKDLNKIGRVEVYYSSKFLLEQFNQSIYKLIVTALLLVIAVSLAVYLVLNQMILSPIRRLTDVANKISIGNLDLEIPIESQDEIGVLADAFARMKVSMAFAIKQLRKR